MKRICILFPGLGSVPIGGYKVLYEYANRFASDGYEVIIVHAGTTFFEQQSFKKKVRSFCRYIYGKLTKWYTRSSWFRLEKSIRTVCVWSLVERRVPKADIYIASSAITSIYLNDYLIENRCKFYFIQHFEDWFIPKEKTLETWKYKLNKIVIAPWLEEIAHSIGETCVWIPNGFDFTYFKRTIAPRRRNKYQIAMMYSDFKLKGSVVGLDAFRKLKETMPELQISLFGVGVHPASLPEWITYYRQPDRELHNKILNESAIFVGTSYQEGWGLPIGEAMICGCAIACTDNGGYRVMALPGKTALVSAPGDATILAENIRTLIENDALRYQLAENGMKFIRQFTWDCSYRKFVNFISQTLNDQ